MKHMKAGTVTLALVACLGLGACGGNRIFGDVRAGTGGDTANLPQSSRAVRDANPSRSTIWDLFRPRKTDQVVKVNKYIWNASLEVLNFLPIQSVDPVTGVIVTGYGTPPGGGRAYRATVYIDDPALEARSLNVALQSRGGPVSTSTTRAIEDAILTRARQLRVADSRL